MEAANAAAVATGGTTCENTEEWVCLTERLGVACPSIGLSLSDVMRLYVDRDLVTELQNTPDLARRDYLRLRGIVPDLL